MGTLPPFKVKGSDQVRGSLSWIWTEIVAQLVKTTLSTTKPWSQLSAAPNKLEMTQTYSLSTGRWSRRISYSMPFLEIRDIPSNTKEPTISRVRF